MEPRNLPQQYPPRLLDHYSESEWVSSIPAYLPGRWNDTIASVGTSDPCLSSGDGAVRASSAKAKWQDNQTSNHHLRPSTEDLLCCLPRNKDHRPGIHSKLCTSLRQSCSLPHRASPRQLPHPDEISRGFLVACSYQHWISRCELDSTRVPVDLTARSRPVATTHQHALSHPHKRHTYRPIIRASIDCLTPPQRLRAHGEHGYLPANVYHHSSSLDLLCDRDRCIQEGAPFDGVCPHRCSSRVALCPRGHRVQEVRITAGRRHSCSAIH